MATHYCWKCDMITEWTAKNRRLLQTGSGGSYSSTDRFLNSFELFVCTKCRTVSWSKIKIVA